MSIKVVVSKQELDVLYRGLGELPLKVSGPVFTRLQSEELRSQREGMAAGTTTTQIIPAPPLGGTDGASA